MTKPQKPMKAKRKKPAESDGLFPDKSFDELVGALIRVPQKKRKSPKKS